VRPRASPAASPRLTEVVLNLRVTMPLIAGSETRCASTWDNQDAQGLKEHHIVHGRSVTRNSQ
jgi:hypothetical protein